MIHNANVPGEHLDIIRIIRNQSYIISKLNLQTDHNANKNIIHIKTNKIGNSLKASLLNNNLYIDLSSSNPSGFSVSKFYKHIGACNQREEVCKFEVPESLVDTRSVGDFV